MKAVCVLGSIIRKRDEEPFSIIASYFSENKDGLIKCYESPQASLREKAKKVSHVIHTHGILFLILTSLLHACIHMYFLLAFNPFVIRLL